MSGWQPIETAPKDGTEVLLWGNWAWWPQWECLLAKWDGEGWDTLDTQTCSARVHAEATHWLAIPPLPPDAPKYDETPLQEERERERKAWQERRARRG